VSHLQIAVSIFECWWKIIWGWWSTSNALLVKASGHQPAFLFEIAQNKANADLWMTHSSFDSHHLAFIFGEISLIFTDQFRMHGFAHIEINGDPPTAGTSTLPTMLHCNTFKQQSSFLLITAESDDVSCHSFCSNSFHWLVQCSQLHAVLRFEQIVHCCHNSDWVQFLLQSCWTFGPCTFCKSRLFNDHSVMWFQNNGVCEVTERMRGLMNHLCSILNKLFPRVQCDQSKHVLNLLLWETFSISSNWVFWFAWNLHSEHFFKLSQQNKFSQLSIPITGFERLMGHFKTWSSNENPMTSGMEHFFCLKCFKHFCIENFKKCS